MPKFPILTALKLIKILKKEGFTLIRSSGSHQTFYNESTKKIVAIPVHRGHDLGRGITRAIIEDAGYAEDEFLRLL